MMAKMPIAYVRVEPAPAGMNLSATRRRPRDEVLPPLTADDRSRRRWALPCDARTGDRRIGVQSVANQSDSVIRHSLPDPLMTMAQAEEIAEHPLEETAAWLSDVAGDPVAFVEG